jgi:hypothetical protein
MTVKPVGEELAEKVARMDRRSLMQLLHDLKCDFNLDFTEEFLNTVSLPRLRHIAIAASLHSHDLGVD